MGYLHTQNKKEIYLLYFIIQIFIFSSIKGKSPTILGVFFFFFLKAFKLFDSIQFEGL